MLQQLFVSEVRLKILKLLLLHPDQSYHVRAIVRAVGAEINAVRRELDNLIGINLLRKRQSSNKLFYTVDTTHILYSDLLSLLSKEEGLGGKLVKRLKELGEIKYMMLAKAFLRGRASSALDVDLFVVGDLRIDILEKIIKEYQQETNVEINYSVMTEDEFRHRKRANDHFITKILTQSRTMLVGDEEKFSSVI
ncbi:hypothetical protein GYA27_00155 [candidate division WWE3 bacterium]|uniref:HTH arsR-type domain-containing protein n=1 Tax=candidate division WWE3 bacterium TaxID=2053526 RepID=A0A7X9DJH2_UNCKA|nr:hypothetical protein [candidate division WWE3 bacterium]